jgi:hypothetical protein
MKYIKDRANDEFVTVNHTEWFLALIRSEDTETTFAKGGASHGKEI